MKPLIPVTLVIISGLAGTASAQTQATASVLATVEQDLQLASTGETNFGSFGNFAHTETINPAELTATQTVAQFTATSSNAVVYTCPSELTLIGPGAASMTFTTDLRWDVSADRQSAATPINCHGSTPLDHSPAFFWLGGSLQVLSGQEPGSYSGMFTLTAAYQ